MDPIEIERYYRTRFYNEFIQTKAFIRKYKDTGSRYFNIYIYIEIDRYKRTTTTAICSEVIFYSLLGFFFLKIKCQRQKQSLHRLNRQHL